MSNAKDFSKYFTACAERLISIKGCVINTGISNFTNGEFEVKNPSVEKDSAEVTMYLWEGAEPDAANFSLNKHKAYTILESKREVMMTPSIQTQSTVKYNNHYITPFATDKLETGGKAIFSLWFTINNP